MNYRTIRLSMLVFALAFLTGCTPSEAPSESASPTPTPTSITTTTDDASLPQVVEYVIAQPPGTMTSNQIINAAQRLRVLASDQYSDAELGVIPARLLGIALDGIKVPAEESAPTLQADLVEYAKQIRELG